MEAGLEGEEVEARGVGAGLLGGESRNGGQDHLLRRAKRWRRRHQRRAKRVVERIALADGLRWLPKPWLTRFPHLFEHFHELKGLFHVEVLSIQNPPAAPPQVRRLLDGEKVREDIEALAGDLCL